MFADFYILICGCESDSSVYVEPYVFITQNNLEKLIINKITSHYKDTQLIPVEYIEVIQQDKSIIIEENDIHAEEYRIFILLPNKPVKMDISDFDINICFLAHKKFVWSSSKKNGSSVKSLLIEIQKIALCKSKLKNSINLF